MKIIEATIIVESGADGRAADVAQHVQHALGDLADSVSVSVLAKGEGYRWQVVCTPKKPETVAEAAKRGFRGP